eukprot:1530482-Rhodomonas_salina.3
MGSWCQGLVLKRYCGTGAVLLHIARLELRWARGARYGTRRPTGKRSLQDREQSMRSAVEELECNLELLGLTGVEVRACRVAEQCKCVAGSACPTAYVRY